MVGVGTIGSIGVSAVMMESTVGERVDLLVIGETILVQVNGALVEIIDVSTRLTLLAVVKREGVGVGAIVVASVADGLVVQLGKVSL